jgi:predicted enzyme related to lactoylglutathione lyase
MPTREQTPVGAPCWVDLMTSDTGGTRAFYGQLFGWTGEEAAEEYGGYFMFRKDGSAVAGCMPSMPGSPVTDVWSVYLASDDARKTTETSAGSGGQIVVSPMDVGDIGTMAVGTDSGGAAIGIWEPRRFLGFSVLGEPGTPGWFELQTRDYEASVSFYRDVFHWESHVLGDSPQFRYTTFGEGDNQQAGIMDAAGFLPEGVSAHWSVYFAVEDADAALAKAADLGGSILSPAESTPHGRLAAAADPNGARFKLVELA